MTCRQTDRQASRQIDRQRDRETERERQRDTDRQADKQKDKQTDRQLTAKEKILKLNKKAVRLYEAVDPDNLMARRDPIVRGTGKWQHWRPEAILGVCFGKK